MERILGTEYGTEKETEPFIRSGYVPKSVQASFPDASGGREDACWPGTINTRGTIADISVTKPVTNCANM